MPLQPYAETQAYDIWSAEWVLGNNRICSNQLAGASHHSRLLIRQDSCQTDKDEHGPIRAMQWDIGFFFFTLVVWYGLSLFANAVIPEDQAKAKLHIRLCPYLRPPHH